MDLINIFLIVVGITNLFLSLIIYFDTKKIDKMSALFSLLALNVSFWSIAMAVFREATNINFSLLALKILYVVPIFIPILFLYFIKIFLDKKSIIFQATYYFIWSIFLTILITNTDKFIVGVDIPPIGEKIIHFGDWYILYVIHFVFFFGLSFLLLADKYLKEQDKLTKEQIKFLFMGTFISSSLGMATNLVLPWFDYFAFNWLGNIMTIFFVGFILYAILKYKLFNTKIIATEIFIIFILITLLIDLFFVSSSTELIIKNLILISVVSLSYLIIKSMYKEITTREQIEKLAEDLKVANERLKKLDEQKSEFINLASHQLRGPVASLKGYSSMILEGSYGPASKKIRDVITRLSQSSNALALIIDDFLNLSRIERGKIEFNFAEGNLKEIVESAVEESKQKAFDKKLKLSFVAGQGNYILNMDSEKIRQIISNLIDNSIKYTPKGSIRIKLSEENGKILLKVSDTGIGIPQGSMDKLFKKFSRLENANEENIQGTGLGLYLAKQIIDAHNGKIWAESQGENKGATFVVELKTS